MSILTGVRGYGDGSKQGRDGNAVQTVSDRAKLTAKQHHRAH